MSLLLSSLSKLFATMLALVLTSITVTTVLNQTILSSHYVESKLAATNSYSRLSDGLVKQIGQQPELAANPQVQAQLSAIITPTMLQQKINSALDQFDAYYHGKGPQPAIDLSDIGTQIQAAGVPLPADSGLTKPIPLSSSKQTQDIGKKFDQARTRTIVTAAVLTAALLAVSWQRRRWVALPDVLIVVGVLVGLLALTFGLASSVAGHAIKFDTTSNAFALIGRDLGTSIASDLAKRLGIIAGIFAAVGIGARIWVGKLQSKTPVKPATPAQLKQLQNRGGTLV